MWSGPRNLSTAMMRSFENRADCSVVDEPLYAAYLEATGLDKVTARKFVQSGAIVATGATVNRRYALPGTSAKEAP